MKRSAGFRFLAAKTATRVTIMSDGLIPRDKVWCVIVLVALRAPGALIPVHPREGVRVNGHTLGRDLTPNRAIERASLARGPSVAP